MVSKRNNSVDAFRFLASIIVIAIHTRPVSGNSMFAFWINEVFNRMAVPFFVVCSGYFLAQSNNYKKFWINIFKLYITASLIFLICHIIEWNNTGWLSIHSFFDWMFSFFVSGSYYHLWYLLAILYALPLLIFFNRLFKSKSTYILMTFLLWCLQCFLYVFQIDGNPLLKIVAITIRVLPLLMLGKVISSKENLSKNTIKKYMLALVLLSIEVFILRYKGFSQFSYVIFTLPVAAYGFQCVLHIRDFSPLKKYNKYFRLNTEIYIYHPLVIFILSLLGVKNPLLCFSLTFILTLLLCICLKWKKLYKS